MAKKTTEKKEQKKEGNILFDILNALFTNKEYIQNLTDETIRQNAFMINRRLAIFYPLQAQIFNNTKVNQVDVLKFWSDYLYTGKYPPRWIYTAGAAKSKAAQDTKKMISGGLLRDFCKYYNYSPKDVQTALKLFPEEMTNEIRDFETFYKHLQNATEG